ncbi:MAG TPA: tetratricopeptide repeat protein [Allosphingosinicella sp.]|nr:tetratricopeptide repeat protein [Allosphingosinicella sp.]
MIFVGVTILVQILCVVHLIRNHRNSLWLWAIIGLPIAGSAAYCVVEILPGLFGRREVRAVQAAAVRKLDPERGLRAAREAVDVADTASNRSALADALAEAGHWGEAVRHYREAVAKTPGKDRTARFKLARACLEAGNVAEARRLIEALPESASPSENDRAALLLARSLKALGETDRAIALYAELGERMPGAEAQCRQAALLIGRGRSGEAVPLLEETERRARRLDKMERRKEAEMYDWAARTLAELRGA